MTIDKFFDDFAMLQRVANDPNKVADLFRMILRDSERIIELEAQVKRYKTDHLAQAQRAAELQDEVDRLEHELEKTRRIMARRGETIRRMEEGEL